MKFGKLEFNPANENIEMVGEPTKNALKDRGIDALVAKIDPDLSDTTAFCEAYNIDLAQSVNCVIVAAKRGEEVKYAAVMIPATKRADINGKVRKTLDARKISFAPMDTAVSLSGMEYGAINPIGLPAGWEILVDTNAAQLTQGVIGSGIRGSKLLVTGETLASLPNAKVLDLSKQ